MIQKMAPAFDGNKTRLVFDETAIRSALMLLNQIEVKGIENCKRVTMIEQILQHPEEYKREEEDNGKHCEEKHPVTG